MKDVLKFDTMIATIALLMSSITAGAMLYQTHVIEQQFAATVWPYLSIETTYNPGSVSVQLINDGAGPALIRSAQLLVDGAPVGGWGDLVRAVVKSLPRVPRPKKGSLQTSMSSIDASVAIRAGETRKLAAFSSPNPTVLTALKSHKIGLRFCYCSINERCWMLNGEIGSEVVEIPHAVAECPVGAAISAPI